MTREEAFQKMIEAGGRAQREKYAENEHKGIILDNSIDILNERAKGEAWELQEELDAEFRNYEKILKEIGDVLNFYSAMAVKCEEELEAQKGLAFKFR